MVNKTSSKENNLQVIADKKQILLSKDLAKFLGTLGGGNLRVVKHENKIEIYSNVHSLSKVYIETTAQCNLACHTCIRRTWQEPMGTMKREVFDKLVEQLKEFDCLQTVMFGGFGEPTFHKDILYMIQQVKSLGIKAEMVTNGTLLDEEMLKGLFENGLDTLWVSFDGTNEECFEDIREGAKFNEVVKNLERLSLKNLSSNHKIKVGITFVVMKSNINQLKDLGALAKRVGADMISVSNVLPYSAEMVDQMVCKLKVGSSNRSYGSQGIPLNLPYIDKTEINQQLLYDLIKNYDKINVFRNGYEREIGSCRFIKDRCTFVKWDGTISPCMGLLHSYKTYFLDGVERKVASYSLGDIRKTHLKDIWNSEEYSNFRSKVDAFEFSPCLQCMHCELSETNEEDCYGNTFPTCGGCLWAQGVIQCP
ncbi:radical SAM protein [Desulfitobacterium sp. Sab5]|uniref:radical SAM protein n=1 Tax=Desulfitobacterium nosdiversum TaxID=3375356 RepID=UPI003CE73E4A